MLFPFLNLCCYLLLKLNFCLNTSRRNLVGVVSTSWADTIVLRCWWRSRRKHWLRIRWYCIVSLLKLLVFLLFSSNKSLGPFIKLLLFVDRNLLSLMCIYSRMFWCILAACFLWQWWSMELLLLPGLSLCLSDCLHTCRQLGKKLNILLVVVSRWKSWWYQKSFLNHFYQRYGRLTVLMLFFLKVKLSNLLLK